MKNNAHKNKTAVCAKQDSMKIYIREINLYPLLTIREEKALARVIHGKNEKKRQAAMQTLVQSNLRLVVKIAHDFKGLGLPLNDIISAGNIGLLRAVEKFEPAKGAKFSSYAAWWIKQTIHRSIYNQARTIRIPIQSLKKLAAIKRMENKLAVQLGRSPSDAEIAETLNYSSRTVAMLRYHNSDVTSLNAPIQAGEEGTLEELVPDMSAQTPDTILCDSDDRKHLKTLFAKLNERERQILEMRYYKKQTLEEVSRQIGRTRERVRQIQTQALQKLRMLMTGDFGTISA